MKTTKIIALSFLLTVIASVKAQNTFPATGNVGIGTNSPTEKLDVNGNLKVQGNIAVGTSVEFVQSTWENGFGTRMINSDPGNGITSLNFDVRANSTTWTPSLKLVSNGNVGIGSGFPTEKLDINGNLRVQGSSYILGDSGVNNNFTLGGSNSWIMHTPDDGRTNLYFAAYTNGNWDFAKGIYFKNDGTGIFKNIGIGTDNPDQKLTVKGKIHAEEIIVDLQVPADYVFEKYYTGTSTLKTDYKMPTLAEVEKYTKENNHLPNVPSAKEIQEKGLQVGEMTNILLQKIEELTLYTIEQQKRIEALEVKLAEKK